jgi:glyoxylase-like metal-dependent hydrolase (beta-lactamase superfamily II)
MVTRLTESFWQLSLRGVNGYVLDTEETVLIDAGTPWDDDQIRTELAEAGVEVPDIDRILLTHFDMDHVGALASLAGDLDATVYVRQPDAAFLTGEQSPPVTNHKGLLQRMLGLFVDTPALSVETVEDGESVGSFTAYATPGHTPGHTAYVSEEYEIGVLGDLVRESGGKLDPSGWVISYDTTAVEESIVELADRSPAFEVAAIGHGAPLTEGGDTALAATAERVQS